MKKVCPQITAPKERKSHLPSPQEINLTGNVGELVAAEFAKTRTQVDRIEMMLQSHADLLQQIEKNTKYPFKMFTEDDFEALFGVKPRTQYTYRIKGRLDFIKLPEKVFYTQEHIEEFIKRQDSRNLKKNN